MHPASYTAERSHARRAPLPAALDRRGAITIRASS
jgi:hypothetical protein